MSPVGVAIVGAGVISKQYLDNLTAFPDVSVIAVADIDIDRARAKAAEYGIDVAGDVDTVLGLDEVEIVVNLTIPTVHTAVARAALQAGKHTYSEKPLAADPVDGEKLLAEAAEAGLRVGCAPDTFLGSGLQSACRAIDSGAIGRPLTASATIMNPGPDRWHPDPAFLFARGAGPLFDLGPYYLTGLVTLLGPINRVAALNRQARSERTIGAGPKAGTTFPVEVPTLVTALLDFIGGPACTSTFSFDHTHRAAAFEITGTEASLALPDPNTFSGALSIRTHGADEWVELPVEGDASGRGIGVVDMARAIRAGTQHRASGDLAQHVLEIMSAIDKAGDSDQFLKITSRVPRPEPLPTDWQPHTRTL